MKAKRVAVAILSLLFIGFLILCTYSPLQSTAVKVPAIVTAAPEGAEAESASAPVSSGPKLPSLITPKVTLTGGSFPEDTEELSVVLAAGETALLDQFTQLRKADFSGSTCYDEIAAWASAHPEVDVSYTVNFPDGSVVNNRAESVDLSGLDAAAAADAANLLLALPHVKTANLGTVGGNGFSYDTVKLLQERLPGLELKYDVELLGQRMGPETTELDLTGATPEQLSAAITALPNLTNLQTIHLGDETGGIGWDTVNAIGAACPNAVLDYGFTLWGVQANLSDAMLNFSHIPMNDNGEAVRRVLPLMRNCVGVDMDTCGIGNETMASLQADFPQMNIVWRINFGTNYSVRTDVEKILASSPMRGGDLNSDNIQVLKYCTKVKYLDLGHNNDINDISFVSYMPDLEVFIISINDVSDISPLANCPHLEYLEINSTNVTDLSPLVNCKELVHLNIGRNVGQDEMRPVVSDISPLFELPKLERVWLGAITAKHVPAEQIEQLRAQIQLNVPDLTLPDTPRELKYPAVYGVDTEAGTPSEGNWKIVGYTDLSLALFDETGWLQEVLHPRYKLLREQFGYDNVPNCYSLSYNDPLY